MRRDAEKRVKTETAVKNRSQHQTTGAAVQNTPQSDRQVTPNNHLANSCTGNFDSLFQVFVSRKSLAVMGNQPLATVGSDFSPTSQ